MGKVRKNLPLLILGLAGCLVIVILLFKGPAIFQEGNPLKVALAVARLELTEVRVVKFSERPEKYIFRAGYGERELSDYLEKDGWELKDRQGAGVFYERGGEVLSGRLRMFSRRYSTFEVRGINLN